MAKDLEPHVTALGAALGVTATEKTRASATAEDKRRAMQEFNYVFSHGRDVVKGLLFLAGLKKAARELPVLGGRPRRSRASADAAEVGRSSSHGAQSPTA